MSSSQTVVGTKQYDAFGNLTSSGGSWNGPFSYGGAFGYQSETDTGYQLLGHRYYDPTTGRFLTRDPIGDGRNWYTYCENNPVSYFDADGLVSAPVFVELIARELAGILQPPFPLGESVDNNIREIREAMEFDIESSAATGYASSSAVGIWVEGVRPYGSWDYKLRHPDRERFDDAGNFNYGATGAALGIPLEMLLGAGDFLSYTMYRQFPDDLDDIFWTIRGYRYYVYFYENK